DTASLSRIVLEVDRYGVVLLIIYVFFFQAEDGIRGLIVTGVQTCALPISLGRCRRRHRPKVGRAGRAALDRSRRGTATGCRRALRAGRSSCPRAPARGSAARSRDPR